MTAPAPHTEPRWTVEYNTVLNEAEDAEIQVYRTCGDAVELAHRVAAALNVSAAPPDPPHTDRVMAEMERRIYGVLRKQLHGIVSNAHLMTIQGLISAALVDADDAVRALAGATAPDPDPHTITEPDTTPVSAFRCLECGHRHEPDDFCVFCPCPDGDGTDG